MAENDAAAVLKFLIILWECDIDTVVEAQKALKVHASVLWNQKAYKCLAYLLSTSWAKCLFDGTSEYNNMLVYALAARNYKILEVICQNPKRLTRKIFAHLMDDNGALQPHCQLILGCMPRTVLQSWKQNQTKMWRQNNPAKVQLMDTEIVAASSWSTKKHATWSLACMQLVVTTLLAANRFLLKLPEEMWLEHIFPCLGKDDFQVNINVLNIDVFSCLVVV